MCIQYLGLKLQYVSTVSSDIVIVVSVCGLPGHADPGGVPGLAAAGLAAGAVRGHADSPHPLHLCVHLRRLPHRHTQVSQLSLLFYNILQLYSTIYLLAKLDIFWSESAYYVLDKM